MPLRGSQVVARIKPELSSAYRSRAAMSRALRGSRVAGPQSASAHGPAELPAWCGCWPRRASIPPAAATPGGAHKAAFERNFGCSRAQLAVIAIHRVSARGYAPTLSGPRRRRAIWPLGVRRLSGRGDPHYITRHVAISIRLPELAARRMSGQAKASTGPGPNDLERYMRSTYRPRSVHSRSSRRGLPWRSRWS